MLFAKNDDAGLVLPQFYALGIISFATIVNSRDIIAKEIEIPESSNRICLAGSMPAEKGVEQTLLFTDQSLIFVKAARAFSAVWLFVTKMQSSHSDQTIDVLSSQQP